MSSTTKSHPVSATLSGEIDPLDLELAHHHRVVVTRPRILQPETAPFPTRHGSAVLTPAPWAGELHPISFVLAAIHTAVATPNAVVCFIGHTAPDETPALGNARAESVRCLVEDDAAAWVTLATQHGSIRDVKAYLQYLNAMLGWECHVEAVNDAVDEAAERSVSAFQRQYKEEMKADLREDGICGTKTLEAIFRVMRFEWEKWLHKHDLSPDAIAELDLRYLDASGADRSLPGMTALDGEHGLDALIVESPALGGAEPTADLLYGSEIARHEEYAVPIEPWAWERGPYTIVTDLVPGEYVPKERYTLRSMDGEFETTLTLPDDAVDAGVLELRFFAVPCDKAYELVVRVHEGERYVLFSDVPYNKLHTLATGGLSDAPAWQTEPKQDPA